MNCKNLRDLRLVFAEVVDNPNHDRKSTLKKLLVSLPALEFLSVDVVPSSGPPFMLNCLRKLSLCVDFGIWGHISYVLQLIKCSPNLSELEISVKGANHNVEAFLKCLKTPGFLQLPLNKLEIYIEQPIHIDSSNIAIELSRLPRASPKAELVCDLISWIDALSVCCQ